VTAVAFAPDGKTVLTGSADKTARLWDVATGREIRVVSGHSDRVTAVAFAPDGKTVLTGSADKTARLWNAADGQEVRRYVGHADALSAVAFSRDGRYVLTGSTDKTARIWLTDAQDIIRLACSLLGRDFTAEERAQYGIADTAPTCPRA
jgi:WD40 repeat protein